MTAAGRGRAARRWTAQARCAAAAGGRLVRLGRAASWPRGRAGPAWCARPACGAGRRRRPNSGQGTGDARLLLACSEPAAASSPIEGYTRMRWGGLRR